MLHGSTPALDIVRSRLPELKHTASKSKSVRLKWKGVTVEGEVACLRALAGAVQLEGATGQQGKVEHFLSFSELLRDKASLPEHVKTLNNHLAMRSFLVGYSLTIADLAVWSALKTNPRWEPISKVLHPPYVTRWYNFISHFLPVQQETKEEEVFHIGHVEPNTTVVTRFPPEPSGYLHIGHAKAALLNDWIARRYNGKMILRFDDTNPTKENVEFVDSIIKDLKTLGVVHTPPITHTSDYFDLIQDYARKLIEEGKAYVDDTDVTTMREERMNCIDSKNRNNSIEKNLTLWESMLRGEKPGLDCCLRAKMDMQSANGCMRDPVMYRCNLLPHHRTGSKYKAYPTYDFACPIVDSIEGVTHALRTTEYHDRDEQFYRFIDMLGIRKPKIGDYSRMNLSYTLMSKRKLKWFVDEKLVSGWDDPRFPTIQGMVRRGLQIDALVQFVYSIGASKASTLMEWDKIWNFNKKILDPTVHRYTAVSSDKIVDLYLEDPVRPDDHFEDIVTMPLHPKNRDIGDKCSLRSSRIQLEQTDAQAIEEGEEVTLIGWGNAIIDTVEKKGDVVTTLRGRLNLEGSVKSTKKKLTWIGIPRSDSSTAAGQALTPVPCTLVTLDSLITVPTIEMGDTLEDVLRPIEDTWKETATVGEAALRNVKKGQCLQFNRRGFYICDRPHVSEKEPMLLFYIPDGRSKGASVLQ